MPVTRSHSRKASISYSEVVQTPKKQASKKNAASATKTTTASRYFQIVAPSPVPKGNRPYSIGRYGLIQEEIQDNLFFLCVQSILWNQTWGRSARPVLDTILSLYPNPEKMAQASLPELTLMIYPIGLHNRRAKRLIELAQVWLAAPPCKERRYRKVGYPGKHFGKDVKPNEILDEREGWEIAHLPGIGAYALDSYRIFHRDKLRGVSPDAEPEWKRVIATDKELRAWLVWRWEQEGQHYDIMTGKRTPITDSLEPALPTNEEGPTGT